MLPNRRQLSKILVYGAGGAVVGMPILFGLFSRARRLEQSHLFKDDTNTLTSRINTILESSRLSDERHPKRWVYLYALADSLLGLKNPEIWSKAKSRLNELARSYTCLGSKLDSVFLDELLSALIDGRIDFYDRFIEKLKARHFIDTCSPQVIMGQFHAGKITPGYGAILEKGFQDMGELLKFTRVEDGEWKGYETYFYDIPCNIADIKKEYRSFILTAGARKQGSEVKIKPIMYELEIAGRCKKKNPFRPFDHYIKNEHFHPGPNFDLEVRSVKRDSHYELNASLGIITGEKYPLFQDQLVIIGFTHVYSRPILVPKNFFWHTHPMGGLTLGPEGMAASGLDIDDYLYHMYWKKALSLLLKERELVR